jgi:hypothetical protein
VHFVYHTLILNVNYVQVHDPLYPSIFFQDLALRFFCVTIPSPVREE